MQNKHQKMHIQQKIKLLNEGDLWCFGIFLEVLGLIKSEDLSDQKMTKLLKGAYGIIF